MTKLLTEDLPRLFVRPKKIVLDFQKGKAVGPVTNDFKSGEIQEGNKDYAGELSVTLVDARKLSYVFYGSNLSSRRKFGFLLNELYAQCLRIIHCSHACMHPMCLSCSPMHVIYTNLVSFLSYFISYVSLTVIFLTQEKLIHM